METGEESCVLLGHKAEVTALHLTDGGRILVSGDSSGTILVSVLAHYRGAVESWTRLGYCTKWTAVSVCDFTRLAFLETGPVPCSMVVVVLGRCGTASRTTTGLPFPRTPLPSQR